MICVKLIFLKKLCNHYIKNETLWYNAITIKQDIAWTKIIELNCLCQTDFFKKLCNHYIKNETLWYNAITIEQDIAWTKIIELNDTFCTQIIFLIDLFWNT